MTKTIIGLGCIMCSAHKKCFDAFQSHSYKCNHYNKTDTEFNEWLQSRKEKLDE